VGFLLTTTGTSASAGNSTVKPARMDGKEATDETSRRMEAKRTEGLPRLRTHVLAARKRTLHALA
jgi:hypothetical protein